MFQNRKGFCSKNTRLKFLYTISTAGGSLTFLMNLLTINHLSKTYPGQLQPALNNVSLTVKKGEILGLVGESGSGKTTLLRLMAGLEDADSGTIRLLKEYITGPAHHLVAGHTHIRLVHQDFRLFPNISVRENISYQLRMYTADYQHNRLESMLQLGDLHAVQHKLPRQLSGGEMQRVAVARALADEPLLLLMDEPFSNVDVRRRQELTEAIGNMIRQSRTTTFFVTHDTSEVLAMADRITIMQEGKLIQTATPSIIYTQPATPYVADLFGHANIVTGKQLRKQAHADLPAFIQAHQTWCIRAEWIQVCEKEEAEFSGIVRKVHYLGLYMLWELQIGTSIRWQVYQQSERISSPGEKIYIKVKWDQVHSFA